MPRKTYNSHNMTFVGSKVGSVVGSKVGTALGAPVRRVFNTANTTKTGRVTSSPVKNNTSNNDASILLRRQLTHENLVMMYSHEEDVDMFEESDLDDVESMMSESKELCSIIGSFRCDLDQVETGEDLEEDEENNAVEEEETAEGVDEKDLSECDLFSMTSNAVDVEVARIQMEARVADARRRRQEKISERQNLAAEHVSAAVSKREKLEEEKRRKQEEMQQQLRQRLEAAEKRRNLQGIQKKLFLQAAQRRREAVLLRGSIFAASLRKLETDQSTHGDDDSHKKEKNNNEFVQVTKSDDRHDPKLFSPEGAEFVRILSSVGEQVASVYDTESEVGKCHFHYCDSPVLHRHESPERVLKVEHNLKSGYELKRMCEQLEDIMLGDAFAPCVECHQRIPNNHQCKGKSFSPSVSISTPVSTTTQPNRTLSFVSPEPESPNGAAQFPAASEKKRHVQLLPHAATKLLGLLLSFVEDNIQYKPSSAEHTPTLAADGKPLMRPLDPQSIPSASETHGTNEKGFSNGMPTPTKRERIRHEDPCDVTLRRQQGKINPAATPEHRLYTGREFAAGPAYVVPSFLSDLLWLPMTPHDSSKSDCLSARLFPFLSASMNKKGCGKGLVLAHHLVVTKAIRHVDQKKKEQMMGNQSPKSSAASQSPVTATSLAEESAVKLVAAMHPFYAPIFKDNAQRHCRIVSVPSGLDSFRYSVGLSEEKEEASNSDEGAEIGLLPGIKACHLVALLEAWEQHAKHSAAAEAEAKKHALEDLTKMFVGLHLAMIDREADIRAKQERAKAAVERTGNLHCAEMRRERLVQDKRKEVTAAMVRQLQMVKAKLRRVGGNEHYSNAENVLKQRLRERQFHHKRRLQRTNVLAGMSTTSSNSDKSPEKIFDHEQQ